ncbi:MAG: NUDIX domain-containing protein [Chloroflexi bacterium]|nr:NUDIX domain-containing protein [Chloroflexota bacterium]
MSSGQPSIPHLAATVVLLRPGHEPDGESEVLLIQRPSTMAFGASLHVFPGGKVDPDDRSSALVARSARSRIDAADVLGGNVHPDDALGLHVAALREMAEEVGIELADGPLLRTDRLAPIAHWVTPPFMPRRFSTLFFVADLPNGATPVFEAAEVASHRWVTPSAALELRAAGEIEMWVPTSSVLQRLIETGARSAAEVARRLAFGPAQPPRVIEENQEIVRLAVGAAGALPGRAGIVNLFGQHDLVVVDPGDPSEDAIDAILAAAARRSGALRAIVLTAPDPDHAAGAEALAIPLEIPILVAPGAGRDLPYTTREVADGDRLPADVDLRVRLGPPGSGTLALLAQSSAGE